MNKSMLYRILILLLFSSLAQAQTVLQIKQAWIPEAPPGASILAGYMGLYNPADKAVVITNIDSPAFEKVEMHLSKEVNGMAQMLPQKELKVPARGELQLKSGSYHLMLIKPHQRLKNGNKVQLKLSFSDGRSQSIIIEVKKTPRKRIMKCAAGKCGGG